MFANMSCRRIALAVLMPGLVVAAAAALAVVPALASDAGSRAARAVVAPPVRAVVSYQLGGAFPPAAGVAIVDRDRSAPPVRGRYNVCYINAFQAQPGELAWWRAHHRDLLLTRRGRPIVDVTWHEQLLDTSTASKRRALGRIVGGWIAGCARAGFQAVEPDNLDSWTRARGALTRRDNLALAASLIARAHSLGLAIAQKNAAEVATAGRRLGFDFAVAEECQPYGECDVYTHAYGDRVIEIEYPDNGGPQNFAAACRARGDRISITYRDRPVTPAGMSGYVEQACG
jgi:hypothetical protein